MSSSELRRRDLLATVSGGCITLAGCSDRTTTRSGYGTAYGREYGAE
ncbi:hypothetical protein [Natrinema salaciae]|uniref:Uncharacterized protein n=1 Tax=Natrinema salaciae TaxID=1186196 RepID=A0A1H9PZ22_9EURY|nr:hypothetical protein [Natrinema salaciae]SER53546.1 hypothetical protein SAMN04489841_4039 [Natrinema salaciae]